MNPRLSFFGSIKDIGAIAAAGYDCIEMQVREIVEMNDHEFQIVCQKLKDSPLICEVLDNPVPLDQIIANESFDLDFFKGFLNTGADRAAVLGVKYYIFGNGRTRSLPTSGNIEAAKAKNLAFMRMLADIAAQRGITVLLEPLGPTVSNVIHSIPEAIEYAEVVGKPNVGTFLDYRWFIDRNHPFQMIEEYGQHIRHVHIDNPDFPFPKRLVPRVNDGHDYSPLFQALQKINYKGILSIEANTFLDYPQDLKDGLEFFASFGIERRKALI
jgi:sugar phosphate isomerase/epimerase